MIILYSPVYAIIGYVMFYSFIAKFFGFIKNNKSRSNFSDVTNKIGHSCLHRSKWFEPGGI